MAEVTDVPATTHPLGTSRPALAVDDLPEPEEVFGVRRIGPRELFMYALGPSLIALGISIGSGEWLLGPQAVGQYGFIGVGWVILVSALLQTFCPCSWSSSRSSPGGGRPRPARASTR